MVFYFSGTGNAEWTAREVGKAFNEPVLSMAQELRKDGDFVYELKPDERVFLVFTIHSWGPAVLAKRFVERLTLKGYNGQEVVAIGVCGDNAGNADKILRRVLHRRGVALTAMYTFSMPNNYILMKGFGVDSAEVEKRKLDTAGERLGSIIEDIKKGGRSGRLYVRGGLAWLKSGVVYPLFAKFAIKQRGFYATDKCVSCGKCVLVCPTGNIKSVDGKPQWGNNCVQCTACIHSCPQRAIEFKKITQTQGRYLHPSRR